MSGVVAYCVDPAESECCVMMVSALKYLTIEKSEQCFRGGTAAIVVIYMKQQIICATWAFNTRISSYDAKSYQQRTKKVYNNKTVC